jgi:hypothetical protein
VIEVITSPNVPGTVWEALFGKHCLGSTVWEALFGKSFAWSLVFKAMNGCGNSAAAHNKVVAVKRINAHNWRSS